VTVAAVILAASPESALADADGQARVRRIADAAWSGGALPVVVVAADPAGAVAAALAGASVTLAEPAPLASGPSAQMARGIRVARRAVKGVGAALLWPARFAWVGPETATSLIEAHGRDRTAVVRPAFDGTPGWPVLVPLAALDFLAALGPSATPEEVVTSLAAAFPSRTIELGDPGTTHDATTPRAGLPPYQGPPGPPAEHRHEWGSLEADRSEDAPIEGPDLAPYEPGLDADA